MRGPTSPQSRARCLNAWRTKLKDISLRNRQSPVRWHLLSERQKLTMGRGRFLLTEASDALRHSYYLRCFELKSFAAESVLRQQDSTPVVPGSELVDSQRDLSQHLSRGTDLRWSCPVERLGHSLFYCSARRSRIRDGARLEPQPRPPAVAWIAFALEKSPCDESLQNPGDRTRV
jgi:hypothetical protein